MSTPELSEPSIIYVKSSKVLIVKQTGKVDRPGCQLGYLIVPFQPCNKIAEIIDKLNLKVSPLCASTKKLIPQIPDLEMVVGLF